MSIVSGTVPSTPSITSAMFFDDKRRDRIALKFSDRDYTYGELSRSALQIGRYFVDAGGAKGDRVLLVAENSFFWVASYLGILQAGLVCVPLPMSIGQSDFEFISSTTDSHFAFVQAHFAATRSECLQHMKVVTDRERPVFPNGLHFGALMHRANPHTALGGVEPDDLAALMFTSGSTGKPRGVMVSHRNIVANTKSIIEYLELNENDSIMTVLPFHYCFGASLLHTHLAVGASLVVDNRFLYPEKVLDRMQSAECTGFAGVPSHYQILLRKTSFKRRQFPHLRYVQQAGGHLAPSFVRDLREALPRTKIFVMYGQTEATARLSYVPPERLNEKIGSIGKAIPGVTLRVVTESGPEVSPGQIGEIVAEGENVAHGYWHDPEESAKSFRDGKLHTGDLATTDSEGFIYVVDRAKDFIKCGGKRVSCRQIEERLLEFPELLEAAVIGTPDEVLGEAVKAFVVARNSNSKGLEERVLQFCKQHVAHQLLPKEIVVRNSLPKNSAGKILKQCLRENDGREILC